MGGSGEGRREGTGLADWLAAAAASPLGTHLSKTLGEAATGVAAGRADRAAEANGQIKDRPAGNKVGNMPVAACHASLSLSPGF